MTTKYLTVKEAANKITLISPKLLYKLIKEKRFPHPDNNPKTFEKISKEYRILSVPAFIREE